MRYVRLTERVQAPQFLRVHVRGQRHDIVLHQAERRKLTHGSEAGGFGREYRHPSYFLWLYTAGKGCLRLKGRSHAFRSGTLVLASPGELHTVVQEYSVGTSFLHTGFAMLTPDRTPLLIPAHDLLSLLSGEKLPDIDFPIQLNARLTRQLARLCEEYLGALVPRGMIHCFPAHKAMLDILCFLAEYVYARAEPGVAPADSPLMQVRLEIERRFDENLTLHELARMACLSPEYLCRAFRKAFGSPPLAYQQELRLREAKSLLSTTSLRVSEVADSAGFQSVPHFCRLFRKRVGCTPTAYAFRPASASSPPLPQHPGAKPAPPRLPA